MSFCLAVEGERRCPGEGIRMVVGIPAGGCRSWDNGGIIDRDDLAANPPISTHIQQVVAPYRARCSAPGIFRRQTRSDQGRLQVDRAAVLPG